MESDNKHLKAYKKLRNNIDEISEKLHRQHKSFMQCRKGCDLCCMDYSILPVEYYFIQNELKNSSNKPVVTDVRDTANGCIFLKDHQCTIYEHRPVICRTHGLPLLFTNEDFEWELSTCELNFRQFNYEKFNPDNTYPQDTYNSKLFMLNKEFIAEQGSNQYGEFELIPIKNLAKNL